MGHISKFDFQQYIDETHVKCTTVMHPWTKSCNHAMVKIFLVLLSGSIKFYIPVYVLQIILKGKKVNGQFLKDIFLKSYPRSILYAITYGMLFYRANCALRHWLGSYRYYHIGFVAGSLGGVAIAVESERYRTLNTVMYFNLITETFIRFMNEKNIIKLTPAKETLAFMLCSSVLMYIKSGQMVPSKITNLWFYNPPLKACENSEANSCSHVDRSPSCVRHVLRGAYDYFKVGFVLQMAKTGIGMLGKLAKNPGQLKRLVLSKGNFKFGCFLGSYVAVYRAVCCWLRRKCETEDRIHTLLAGFLAGATYIIKPNLGFLVIAYTTILQLLMEELVRKGYVKKQHLLTQTLFVGLSGILFHFSFLHRSSCPNYVKNMLTQFTNGMFDKVYFQVLEQLPEHCR